MPVSLRALMSYTYHKKKIHKRVVTQFKTSVLEAISLIIRLVHPLWMVTCALSIRNPHSNIINENQRQLKNRLIILSVKDNSISGRNTHNSSHYSTIKETKNCCHRSPETKELRNFITWKSIPSKADNLCSSQWLPKMRWAK